MKQIARIATVVVVALLVPGLALAQVFTGQISGRVTDATGAVLPGVTVTATQTETKLVRSTTTNELGVYALTNLPVGPYQLEAGLQGFTSFAQSAIVLQVNANLVIDPVLKIGNVAETVTVEARASDLQVETRRMGVGTVVEQERIVELPLNARQVTDLITLSGAAVVSPPSATATMVTGVNISVAGGMRFGVQYLLDGAMSNNRFDATNMPLPFPDALQEFRVSTSAQEAAIGRSTGASVNAVTKSGTNVFHGNAFWFGRDTKFTSRPAHLSFKPILRRNQPGGSLGGPILQNRLFFFTGYQSTILDQTLADTVAIVPTAAMLAGDWSAFNACHAPKWNAGLGADFADGSVSPSIYSPAAVRLAARLPQPSGPRAHCGELLFGNRVDRHDKQTVTRVDYQHSASQSFFGRYMATLHDQPVTFDPDNLLTATAVGSGFNDTAQAVTVGHNWILGANAVGATRFAYNGIRARKQGARFFNPEDVGINHWTSVPNFFPVDVTGNFTFGFGPLALRTVDQNQYQIGHDFTLVRGAHQYSLGGSWAYDDVLSLAHTRGVGGITIGSGFTGHGMGDFLLGRVTQMRQSMPSTLSPSQHYAGFYAQDTWRVTPRVTLNYGVRWEPFFPMVWEENPYGGIRVYRFSIDAFKAGQKSVVFPFAPAGISYPSQSSDGSGAADFEGGAGIRTRLNKWAPRIGVGWDPTGSGRTAIRGSYGIANDVVALEALLNSNNVSPWSPDISNFTGTLDNPWLGQPGGNPFPFDWQTTARFVANSSLLPFSPDLDTPYVHSWNATVEQQFFGNWLVSASYLGSRSERLWNITAINPALILTPASHPSLFTGPDTCVLAGTSFTPCNQATNVNNRRDLRIWAQMNNPALLADAALLSSVDEFRSDSTAEYRGLLTSVRGVLPGVNLDANYTVSRCMTDRVAMATTGIPNPNETFHVGRDRTYCPSDRRHLFNLTAVTTSPEFDHPLWRAIASDWRFAALYRVSSGDRLTISAGSDRALTGVNVNAGNAGFTLQTANQVLADPYLDTSGDLGSKYLNADAFVLPPLGTYGTTRHFSVVGPTQWSLDVALSRLFDVGAHRVEVRVEAFNLPNAVIPVNPATSITAPNFGVITTARDPRIMQFAVKYVF